MSEVWPEGWSPGWDSVGETSNTAYYVDHRGVLLALPHRGAHDTKTTAVENLAFQKAHFRSRNDPPVVAIFFDRLASQDRMARKAYADDPSSQWSLGFALIGGTMLTRAMGSFFLGLTRPDAPLKMFKNITSARPWIDSLQQRKP
ncbi:MAG: hypothetical protein K0V04_15275 [Deltaproteobacteria bacterium]|nr:hypothetical protein [Deltaproteobacteria bacterium]